MENVFTKTGERLIITGKPHIQDVWKILPSYKTVLKTGGPIHFYTVDA